MQLEKQIWALEAFVNSVHVLTRSKNEEALISGVCDCITNQESYLIAWVGISQNDTAKTVRVAGISGKAKAYAQGLEVSWDESLSSGQGPTGRAIRNGESTVVQDSEQDASFAPWRKRAKVHGIRSSVAVPIYEGESITGALMVYSGVPNAFTPPELLLFQSLANEIGVGLGALKERAKLAEERRANELAHIKLLESLELTIGAMATTMELRDPYTSGHQRRVANISEAIAREMGLDENKVLGLKLAAMIHDMGKVSIPSELLTKPTKLSNLEYSLIQEHANNGYLIFKDIPFIWPIAEIVRQHHERMDGSGYPRGLKGDEILQEARILAVADTIESMSSHRPYRAALGLDKAIETIQILARDELDHKVVEAATNLFERQEMADILSKP